MDHESAQRPLEPRGLQPDRSTRPVDEGRPLDPSKTFGDWGVRSFDQVVVSPGAEWRGEADLEVERVVYVLSGEGSVRVGEESVDIGSGDAIPILRAQPWRFAGGGDGDLDLMNAGAGNRQRSPPLSSAKEPSSVIGAVYHEVLELA